MCDFFWQRMENVDQGDLADIVCPGGRGSLPAAEVPAAEYWKLLSEPMAAAPNFPSATEGPANDFGDPFVNLRDPLLNRLTATGVEFLSGAEVMTAPVKVTLVRSNGGGGGGGGGGGVGLLTPKLLMGDEVKRPCDVLSRVLQISPGGTAKPPPLSARVIKPAPLMISNTEMMKVSSTSPAACPADQSGGGGAQISSPRTPGIKRRKSLTKKVVCIAAPTAASNRPSTGEVVPSDLWAWRKYGQKPIKGSPYPRGYYRCSSSKGCSARKQVERSRTDPNMLVITYTSEHNHPWPTQRNALAGSTRSSQPTKNSSSSSSAISKSVNIISPQSIPTKNKELCEEITSATSLVKGEFTTDLQMEINAIDHLSADQVSSEFDQFFHQNYKPMIPESSHPDDFFADLAELEPDPMSLIFAKGFTEKKPDHDEDKGQDQKALDPFNMFDWVAAGNSFGEAKKGL